MQSSSFHILQYIHRFSGLGMDIFGDEWERYSVHYNYVPARSTQWQSEFMPKPVWLQTDDVKPLTIKSWFIQWKK